MSEALNPSFNPPAIPVPPAPTPRPHVMEPPVNLLRVLGCLLSGVVLFDICFWKIEFVGFSFGLFFLVLAGVILASRDNLRMTARTWVILALLAGACWAATVETGITNTFVLLALTALLAAESYYTGVESAWGRALSQLVALIIAPGRVFWLGARVLERSVDGSANWLGRLIRYAFLAVPAIILALVFGFLLSMGNGVFGSWVSDAFNQIWKEILLCFDPVRIVWWLIAAFLLLPLLRPASVGEWCWRWATKVPRVSSRILSADSTFLSSLFILIVLNALFLVANIADAIFLWSGQTLPAGVEYKSYVHEGVGALITTVLLTAVVLTAIFQQSIEVARRWELKALAFAWIAQNLFLILSVTLRIKYYIVNYELSVLRLGVIIFLILVAAGFVLLTYQIIREKSLSWLIGACLIAVFAQFYITQFLDLGGWSANYNAAAWEKDRNHLLDLEHMYEYGPAAWPAMRKVHDIDPSKPILNVDTSQGFPETTRMVDQTKFNGEHWRDFSFRAYWNSGALEK